MARNTSTATPATKPAKTTTTRVANVVAKATGRAKVASKVCRVCGVNKPLTDYRVKSSRPDGRDSICTADARLWLANRNAIRAAAAKSTTTRAKTTAKTSAKVAPAKPKTTTAKVAVAKAAALPAREAAARARDAKAKVATVAK